MNTHFLTCDVWVLRDADLSLPTNLQPTVKA